MASGRDDRNLQNLGAVDTGSAMTRVRRRLVVLQPLFESPDFRGGGNSATYRSYDVLGNGEQFLTVATLEGAGASVGTVRVVQKWHRAFRGQDRN